MSCSGKDLRFHSQDTRQSDSPSSMPRGTRPDRMTYEGIVWNAEAILDRLECAVLAVNRGHSPPTIPHGVGGGASTASGSVSGDEEDKAVETVFRPLPRSMTECIRGVILISTVLPPLRDYVGRVGTGLAFRRTEEGTWSDTKPCSLTAFVSPIPDRSHKEVLDTVLFICNGSDKENNDWWNELSRPMGLLVSEDSGQLSKTNTENPEDGHTEAGPDEKYLDSVIPPNQSNIKSDRQRVWKATNLTSLVDAEEYPFLDRNTDPDTTRSPLPLYFYCWNKDHLLKEAMVSLERVVIKDFIPVRTEDTVSNEDAGRLGTSIENLLRRPDNASVGEVIQEDIPADVRVIYGDPEQPNMESTEELKTLRETHLGDPSTEEAGAVATDEPAQEDGEPVSPGQPAKAPSESQVPSFVSDEYC